MPQPEPVVRTVTDAMRLGRHRVPVGHRVRRGDGGVRGRPVGLDGRRRRHPAGPRRDAGRGRAPAAGHRPGRRGRHQPAGVPTVRRVRRPRRPPAGERAARRRRPARPGSLDRAFAEATATGRRAAYLLCHPHNPTGTLHTRGRAAGGRRAGRPARRAGGRRRDPRPARARRRAAGSCPRRRRSPTRSPCTPRRRRSTWRACAPRSRYPDRRRWTTSPACPRSSPTASRTSARSPSRPPTARAAPGWTRCSTGSGTTSALVADLLAEHLPAAVWSPPEATYFAWIDLRALDAVRGGSGSGPARPAPRPSRAQPRTDVRRRGDRLRPPQPGRLDGDADGRRGPARSRPGGASQPIRDQDPPPEDSCRPPERADLSLRSPRKGPRLYNEVMGDRRGEVR